MRLKLLSAREQAMGAVLDEARRRLAELSSNTERYRVLLTSLIVQGAKKLGDANVIVLCRETDAAVAREAVAAAKVELPGTSVTLDETSRLPAAPACSGGVQVTNSTGLIVCDNTLDARLRIAYERGMPAIREKMFSGDSTAQPTPVAPTSSNMISL